MLNNSQKHALDNYRTRLRTKVMARFDMLGLDADRTMIRALARRLAEAGTDAERIRADIAQSDRRSSLCSGWNPGGSPKLPACRHRDQFDGDHMDGHDIEL